MENTWGSQVIGEDWTKAEFVNFVGYKNDQVHLLI
jgi:hypothetical protein